MEKREGADPHDGREEWVPTGHAHTTDVDREQQQHRCKRPSITQRKESCVMRTCGKNERTCSHAHTVADNTQYWRTESRAQREQREDGESRTTDNHVESRTAQTIGGRRDAHNRQPRRVAHNTNNGRTQSRAQHKQREDVQSRTTHRTHDNRVRLYQG